MIRHNVKVEAYVMRKRKGKYNLKWNKTLAFVLGVLLGRTVSDACICSRI